MTEIVAQATGRCTAQLTSALAGRLEDDAALATPGPIS